MISMSWDEVRARQLAQQFLAEPASADRIVDVVGAVGGVHAQVTSSAELAIGLRVADITRKDVREELWERRALVRIYGIRGTIHLFPSAELALWLATLRAAPPLKRSPLRVEDDAELARTHRHNGGWRGRPRQR